MTDPDVAALIQRAQETIPETTVDLTDAEWAIDRVTRMAGAAYADAIVYRKKLLKGFGYPNETFSRAQDARALSIVLALLTARETALPPDDQGPHLWADLNGPAGGAREDALAKSTQSTGAYAALVSQLRSLITKWCETADEPADNTEVFDETLRSCATELEALLPADAPQEPKA